MDLEKQPQKPAAPVETGRAEHAIRASDADRDRIADILRDALAEGRLDAEEHSERIDAVYRAKTLGELEPIVRDLPAAVRRTGGPPYVQEADEPTGPAENLVAVFSSSTRKGRWRVGRRTNAFSLFGSVEIDLTEALFGQRLTVINATSIFGSVDVRVPENITLRGSGTGFFGNFEVLTLEAADPEAPVVVVNGYSVFGNVEAKPKRGRRISDLHDRLRKHLG
ncbi:DUF1707 and DUF2154 domain-containing protein [Streptomyces sp. ISL-10]|uniref:DUF1707 SHOCT-like domain-containing protein n=1 Tax=Streptomyces sp. ISL-10 TaxID=2819172 RepID=UPI001BE8B4CE|nr:DUF1707 domain-containing protein [Streptomyces sp. ISL-10]MBT2365112.1 DUF1707 and DUF2154 domain-containing protein [Streptomyces sp. ISL-10]